MSNLTLKEIERYQRHLSLPQFGEAAQLKLKQASVLVVGAGGLGCPVLQYLTAAGVGKLGVMDFDVVDVSNLQRQILFTEADVGRPKAEVACERLRAMNSLIEIIAIPQRLTAANALELFSQFDVIVDGSDNFTTRYLVNDACVLAKKPLVYGAIYTFQGQVSVFNFKNGPTYRCLFPDPPDPKDAPNCSEIGVIGVLPGLIGTLQASEVIKVLTGIGEPLSGSLLLLDVLTMKQQTIRFNRVPEAADVKELVEINFSCAVEEALPKSEEIDVGAFRSLLGKGGELQVLDVREDWERAVSKLDSFHIPLGLLLGNSKAIDASGLDLTLPTVVYCRSGMRSLKALHWLQEHHGFQDIHSLKGGLLEWERTFGTAGTLS
jgi:sulfur-carrier protein adenylyltransferase/sulfurtransferase